MSIEEMALEALRLSEAATEVNRTSKLACMVPALARAVLEMGEERERERHYCAVTHHSQGVVDDLRAENYSLRTRLREAEGLIRDVDIRVEGNGFYQVRWVQASWLERRADFLGEVKGDE